MKTNIINILQLFLCLSFFSCGKKNAQIRTTNVYTQEELVVIEFATRMEEQEYKYKDYHKTEK
jgi:hypothetical protein